MTPITKTVVLNGKITCLEQMTANSFSVGIESIERPGLTLARLYMNTDQYLALEPQIGLGVVLEVSRCL